MKISCIQMDMEFCNPSENYIKAEKLIEEAMKECPDVLVLPEMWNTGFFPHENLAELSDKSGEETKKLMSALSKKPSSFIGVKRCVLSYSATHSPSLEKMYAVFHTFSSFTLATLPATILTLYFFERALISFFVSSPLLPESSAKFS